MTTDVLDLVFQEGVAADLGIRYWRGQRQLRPEDLKLDPKAIPDIFSLGRKMLVPRHTIRKFHALEMAASSAVERHSFPLPVGSGRFIPNTALDQALEAVNRIQAEFEAEAKGFLSRYGEYQREMLERYPQHATALLGFYPTTQEVRKRFSFGLQLYAISLPKGAQAKLLPQKEARRRARSLQETANRARNALNQRMDSWLEEVAGLMRQETTRVVGGLAEAIAKGRVHPSQIEALRTWEERFRSLNFLGDREMEAQLASLRSHVNGTGARELNASPDALAALGQAVQRAAEVAQASVAPVVAGYRRIMMG